MEANSTFSESWHRVSGQHLALHPAVQVRRQMFRGERWYVLEHPFTNQFFRLRPVAYEFVARLHRDRTIDSVWRECLERFPAEAPGQEAVVRLLGQLYQANLLQYESATDTSALFQRHEKREQREFRARITNVMFFRIPLWDPDRFLVRSLGVIGWLFSPAGFLLWLAVIGLALKTVVDHWSAVRDQSQSILAPANLAWLYLAMVGLKTLHELGHGWLCRKYGGEVHTLGLMFMIFTPVPYVDVTSSWSFRSAWQRVLVGAGGMIVELFVAALATFIWARSGPGVVHSVAYNIMFIASVSTLVFNLNPLLRFDGYYILSDLCGLPNLGGRANQELRHLSEKHILGVRDSSSPARTGGEAAWLAGYGAVSGVYRVIVFAGVLFSVADRYMLLGVVMLAVCFVSWIVVPTGKFVTYLGSSPRLDRVRGRAIAVVATAVAALVLLLGVIPAPNHFQAPGIVEASQRSQVVCETAGKVLALSTLPGGLVRAGQPLLALTNRELSLELVSARAALAEVDARLHQALGEQAANYRPLEARRVALTNRLARLLSDQSAQIVTARHDGVWVVPASSELPGRWVARGTAVGWVINPGTHEFTATVSQADADRLFHSHWTRAGTPLPLDAAVSDLTARIRLRGEAGVVVPVRSIHIVPAERDTLPSAALGWQGGGELAPAKSDPHGLRSAESFFEVRADLPSDPGVRLVHGRSGRIRFDLPAEPYLQQWVRLFAQFLQRRYQL